MNLVIFKDGYTIKQIANNRTYYVFQIKGELYDLMPVHEEYELTKNYS